MFYDYTIFANADLPAARVKTFTALIAENKDALAQGQPLFNEMDAERLFNKINVPYHDGAVAYFKEKGIKETQVNGPRASEKEEAIAAATRPKSTAPIAAELFLQRWPSTASTISSPIPAPISRRLSRLSARARKGNAKLPRPILVPHENLAVAMAHGVYLMTGRPQGVMVHVNVGTANTINNARQSRARPRAADRSPPAARRSPRRAAFGSRDRARSTGRRKCSTRPAWCASW